MRIEINPRIRILLEQISDKGLCLQGRVENCQAKGAFNSDDLLDLAQSAEAVLDSLLVLQEIALHRKIKEANRE